MNHVEIQLDILKFLKNSGVSDEQKSLMQFSLPFMSEGDLRATYKILSTEQKKIAHARKEAKRIEMKYQFMIDDLAEMEIKKVKAGK